MTFRVRALHRSVLALLLLAAFAPARPAAAEEPLRIFVMPFESQSRGLKEQSRVLFEAMTSALLGTGRFLIASASTGDAEVEAAVQSCNRDAVDQTCWIRVGFSKGAQKLVSGKLSGQGKTCYVTLRMVDLETRLEERRVFDAYSCKVEDLLSRVEGYAWRLAGVITPAAPSGGQDTSAEVNTGQGGAAPAAMGVLRVTTTPPGASVYVDAELRGKSPLTLEDVAAGDHSLLITSEGYVDLAKTVTVQAGRPALVREKLVRQSGTLEVDSVPSGADVFLDGKRQRGKTPLTLPGIPPGEHQLKVTLAKHRGWENPVQIDANTTVRVMADLQGREGKVLVSSSPKGARVAVDGVDRGKTVASLSLAPGSHTLRVELDGYEPQTREIVVAAGSTQSISLTLTRQAAVVAGPGDLSRYEITLFTPESRTFDAKDTAALAELERMGFRIDRRNYPSNPDANIKVGRGNGALGTRVQAVLARHYPGKRFEIKEIFEPGDTDVFINLGADAAGAPTAATPGVDPGSGELGRYEITLFTPDKRAFNPSDLGMLDEFGRMGFRVDRRNYSSNPNSNIKVGRGNRALGERVKAVVQKYYRGDFTILDIFSEGDTDVFINVGPAVPLGGGGVAASVSGGGDGGVPNVVIFTPNNRPFLPADQQLISRLRAAGYEVKDSPGGGGSNSDSNVKVGRGKSAIGQRVREIIRECYDSDLTVKELFEPNDRDVYVNLGDGAQPKASCGGGGGASSGGIDFTSHRIRFFTPGGRALNGAERGLQTQFRGMGFKVEEDPLGSDQPPNIKVGADKTATGQAVKEILERALSTRFELRPVFSAGDGDVFITLGNDGGASPPAASGSYSGHRIRFFTPGGRALNTAERALQTQFRGMGFKVEEEPLGSDQPANVKVGSDKTATGEAVKAILERALGKSFELRPVFSAGDGDVFINVGPDSGGGGSDSAPSGSFSGHRIRFFTPGGRALNAAERALQTQFRGMGFKVEEDPLGSDQSPNIKVGADKTATGQAVKEILERTFSTRFELRPVFQAGDGDVFITLGNDGGGGAAPSGDFSSHRIRFFTPGGRALNAAEKGLQARFRSMGFKVEDEPLGSDQPPHVKVGSDKTTAGQAVIRELESALGKSFELRAVFSAGDGDVFINVGPDPAGPAAAAGPTSQYKVVIFTPGGRALSGADRTVLRELRAKGFQVQEREGEGGSNPDSNVKVGRGARVIGDQVREIVRRCYDQPLEVQEMFREGDTDVYVNLGQGADGRVKCRSTSL